MPFILGNESSGTVVAVGSSVDTFAVGDEVVSYSAGGGFAEFCLSKATRTAKVPAGMGVKDAATGLLQGLTGVFLRFLPASPFELRFLTCFGTAVTLTHEAHEVKKGQYILIPACAGGLGLLLTQICTLRGAIVIGTCSTPAKALLAKAAGAAHVFLSDGSISDEELVGEIHKITGGEGIDRGVSASFDGVGKDTFELSMAALRRKGTMVTCGNASGAVPYAPPLLLSLLLTSGSAFAPLRLAPKALKICRPVLNQYIHTPSEFTQYSTELFGLIARGELKLSRWKEEGYEFSAQGIKSAQEDISTSLFYLLQCGELIEYSVSQDDGKIASQSGGMNGSEKKDEKFRYLFLIP